MKKWETQLLSQCLLKTAKFLNTTIVKRAYTSLTGVASDASVCFRPRHKKNNTTQ
jgi:hypothetical protein